MSRAERRADRAARQRFARKAGGNMLVHLFEAGESIEGRPFADIVTRAVADFHRATSGCCCSCKASFGYGCAPAAFAVAHAAARPGSAVLLAACQKCWSREDYLEVLSDAAEASLSKLLPAGRWLEPLP